MTKLSLPNLECVFFFEGALDSDRALSVASVVWCLRFAMYTVCLRCCWLKRTHRKDKLLELNAADYLCGMKLVEVITQLMRALFFLLLVCIGYIYFLRQRSKNSS